MLAQPVIGLDQTSWKRLDGKAKTPWQMWCLTAPGAVVHRIRDDKGAATFKALVGSYRGVIVCDALKTHEAGARGNDAIALAGCWAHVFRKFEEAAVDHPEARLALQWIGKLYEIDERAEGDLETKTALRRAESTDIIAALKAWVWNHAALRTLSIGNAAAYVVANWERLTGFLKDARIPLDNNATERGIRGPVVGRKNHYGSRSRRGTEVASIFYSLLETTKLRHVDPALSARGRTRGRSWRGPAPMGPPSLTAVRDFPRRANPMPTLGADRSSRGQSQLRTLRIPQSCAPLLRRHRCG